MQFETARRVPPSVRLGTSYARRQGMTAHDQPIRLAIAEEHTLFRWGLREAFAKVLDMTLVGEAGTVAEALEMIRSVRPEVLLLDATLPDHSGFDVLEKVRELDSGPLIVMLGGPFDTSLGARAIMAGAHAYVAKSAQPDELLDAIRAVSRGERVIPPAIEMLLVQGDARPAGALTKRELEVMEMIARGMTNGEIAHDLGISAKTFDTHRSHVMKKLHLRNNSDITRFAVKHGYVTV